jgi:flavin reductase (DIM6/NTAB) family NADH-FMN oxidoreductase RutF
VPHRLGHLGVPVLEECYAHFECQVANAMDTGSSTCFLGDVVSVGMGVAPSAATDGIMTAAYFRANLPAEWRGEFEEQLKRAQRVATERSTPIVPLVWRGLGS